MMTALFYDMNLTEECLNLVTWTVSHFQVFIFCVIPIKF